MERVTLLFILTIMVALAYAAPSSADYVTTTTGGSAETPTIHAVNEGGHVTIQNSIGNISCSSTIEGTPTSHGEETPVSGPVSVLTFTGCTNSWHVTTEYPGSLSLIWTSGHNGTLFSSGAKVRTTRFTVNCVYETENTHIGTVTGGNPATLHIEADIPINDPESSGLCGEGDAAWEGNYVIRSVFATKDASFVTTTTGGEPGTPTIHAVNEGGHLSLENDVATIECSSTAEGAVESHGGKVASGIISTLTFTGCTHSWHVTTEFPGSLSLSWTSGHNGTLVSSGAKVRTTRFTVNCVYETELTHIGTVTGGNPATLHIEAEIPINDPESSGLCGEGDAAWEGNYVTTSALYVGGQTASVTTSGLYIEG